jgi:hypothetical protein
MLNKAANPAQTHRLSDWQSVRSGNRVPSYVSQKRNLPFGSPPFPYSAPSGVLLGVFSLRGCQEGKAHLIQGSLVALSPSMVPETLTGATVSLVPEEEAVVLPTDKLLQNIWCL